MKGSGLIVISGMLLLVSACTTNRSPMHYRDGLLPKYAASHPEGLVPPGSRLGLAVSATKTMETPKWRSRAVNRTTGAPAEKLGGATVEAIAGGRELGALASAGAWAGYLLYLPVGAGLGVVGGSFSEHKWQPCMGLLSGELETADVAGQLETGLTNALGSKGIDDIVHLPPGEELPDGTNEGKPKVVLQADIQRVVFSECRKRWMFEVGTQVRGRLWDTDTKQYVYDNIYVNTHKLLSADTSYIPSSECRKIEEYCGDQGTAVFGKDLVKAIDATASTIIHDLTLRREYPQGE